jgi:hypothetical protein
MKILSITLLFFCVSLSYGQNQKKLDRKINSYKEIKSILIKAQVNLNDRTLNIESKIKPGIEMETIYSTSSGYNSKRRYKDGICTDSSSRGVEQVTGDELLSAGQGCYLYPPYYFLEKNIAILNTEKIKFNAKKAYQYTYENGNILIFDSEYNLLKKIVPNHSEIEFTDYRDINGYLFATKAKVHFLDHPEDRAYSTVTFSYHNLKT